MIASDPDAAWLASARARVAAGIPWERSPAEVERAAHARHDARPPTAGSQLHCPHCDAHPPLETFRRSEIGTNTPLCFCPACYGFWAAGDSLARGVADPHDHHPALVATQAPRRCRVCNGHLKPNGGCTKCGRALPEVKCPACAVPMERTTQKSVTVDGCPRCHGTWFDMGEISAVFGVSPPQALAAASVDETALEGAPPPWLVALEVLLRLFLRF